MNTKTTRINITLPTAIVEELKNLTGPRLRSRFVAEALKDKIEQIKEEKIKHLLTEGYRATRHEALEITNSFEAIDIGGWDEY
jgi:metal-responsive CopG/Arc/MetJ family transcriptional regulator